MSHIFIMKIKSISVFWILLFAFSFNMMAQQKNANNNNENNYAFADSIMQATYKANEPGAVLLIAKDGYPVFEKAYGLANMELQILNRPDTLFIQTTNGNKTPLTAIAKDTFIQLMSSDTGSFFYRTYHFTRDPNGKVNAITAEVPLNMFMKRTELKVDLPSPGKP